MCFNTRSASNGFLNILKMEGRYLAVEWSGVNMALSKNLSGIHYYRINYMRCFRFPQVPSLVARLGASIAKIIVADWMLWSVHINSRPVFLQIFYWIDHIEARPLRRPRIVFRMGL